MKEATRIDSVMFIIRVSHGWQFFMLGKWSVESTNRFFELSVIFPPPCIAPSLHSYSDIFSNPELLIIPVLCVCTCVRRFGREWRGGISFSNGLGHISSDSIYYLIMKLTWYNSLTLLLRVRKMLWTELSWFDLLKFTYTIFRLTYL